MIDWSAIRQEYEQGASLRSLATKHEVSKTYIIEKRNKENWNRPDRPTANRPLTDRPPTPIQHFPIPDDAATIARIGLHQLAQHLQTDDILPIASHKSLSDALAQYVKVLIVAPRETEAQDVLSVPLNKISPRTRLAIQRLLDEDAESQEQEKVG
jgi:hypothetical protein